VTNFLKTDFAILELSPAYSEHHRLCFCCFFSLRQARRKIDNI